MTENELLLLIEFFIENPDSFKMFKTDSFEISKKKHRAFGFLYTSSENKNIFLMFIATSSSIVLDTFTFNSYKLVFDGSSNLPTQFYLAFSEEGARVKNYTISAVENISIDDLYRDLVWTETTIEQSLVIEKRGFAKTYLNRYMVDDENRFNIVKHVESIHVNGGWKKNHNFQKTFNNSNQFFYIRNNYPKTFYFTKSPSKLSIKGTCEIF